MRFYQGIRFKIILGILLILGGILVSVNYLILTQQKQLLLDSLIKRGEHLTALVAKTSISPLFDYKFFILQEIAIKVEESPEIAFCEIYDAQGISLTTDEANIEGTPLIKKVRQTGENIRIVEQTIIFEDQTLGKVEIGMYLDQINQEIQVRTYQLAMAFLIIMGLSALLLKSFLSYFFISPLIQLAQASKALAEDQILELNTKRKDELGFLARRFVEMRDSIQAKIDEVRESEHRLRQVIDLVPHRIFAKDWQGKFLLVNRATAELYNTTVEELVGQCQSKVHFDKKGAERMLQSDREVIDNHQSKVIPEQIFINNQGEIYINQVFKIPFTIAGIQTSLGVVVDITELKNTQSKLHQLNEKLEHRVEERTRELTNTQNQIKEREENLDRIFETVSFPMAIASFPEGKLLRVNQATLEFHKLSEKELFQFQSSSIYANLEDRKKIHQELAEQGQSKNAEVQFKRLGTGEKRWVVLSLCPITYFGESALIGIHIDITERKQLEMELITAKQEAEAASRAKSDFLANMSHELRTPMNAILGFSHLMVRDPQIPPSQQENLNVINHSGEHLLSLINDILDMSKIEAGRIVLNPHGFDLDNLLTSIEEMIRIQARRKALQLTVERRSELPQYVKSDERKLRQVLINLLGNAVKFTNGGSITLRVSNSSSQTGGFPSHLLFEIEDTGIGMSTEEIEHIFEPFVQTQSKVWNQEGTGLGLPISRQFVHLMGGEITVKSKIGQGSIFKFDIQIEPANMPQTEKRFPPHRIIGLVPDQPEGRPRSYRILVVEDQDSNRALLRALLESVGFEVREATNGQEGIEQFEQWHPHLIWMDMRMPVLNGYEATKQIKASKQRKTIVIALTASVFEEDKASVMKIGCDDFIRKPFRETEIFEVMEKHLKVRYLYEEEQTITSSKEALQEILPPEMLGKLLAELPEEWVAELKQATLELDMTRILNLIEQIQKQSSSLADTLAEMTRNYKYEELLSLLSSSPPSQKNEHEQQTK